MKKFIASVIVLLSLVNPVQADGVDEFKQNLFDSFCADFKSVHQSIFFMYAHGLPKKEVRAMVREEMAKFIFVDTLQSLSTNLSETVIMSVYRFPLVNGGVVRSEMKEHIEIFDIDCKNNVRLLKLKAGLK